MKKLIILILLVGQLSFGADFITPIFHQLGADDSQIGHCIAGQKWSEMLEDNFGLSPLQSLVGTYLLAEFKEWLDVQSGSYRNPKDVLWTVYGWGGTRLIQWEIKF